MNWDDGCKYDGDWKDDVRHGKGVFEYTNGDKYDGDWADDIQHGKRYLFFPLREIATKVLIFWENVPEKALTIMPMEINM